MGHPLLLLLPVVVAATRSLAFGIQSPNKSAARSAIPAELEYQFLLVVIFCLAGLLISLYVVIRFPDFGTAMAEANRF